MRVYTPAELHQMLAELCDYCEWPGCTRVGAEVAHLHSTGMGGRPSAHTLQNVAWLCRPHALMSDQVQPAGVNYRAELLALLGTIPDDPSRVGYEVAEALTARVAALRGWAS